MTRLPLVSLSLAALGFAAAAHSAEETTPVLKSTPAVTAAPKPPRSISPGRAAQLAAVTPKYAEVIKPAEPAAAPDARETEKPRNTIIRLPRYLVQEERPPALKEREVETPRARLARALRKYPGLHFGSFWIFRNDAVALAMIEEEDAIERGREYADLLSLLSIRAGPPPASGVRAAAPEKPPR